MKQVVISFISTKGGVGKTTLCANVAALAAALGQRVLMIDADIQPSLSRYFQIDVQAEAGMAEVIERGGKITEDCISKTVRPNLDLVVSNMTDATQHWLRQRDDRLILLKRAIRQSAVVKDYNLIFIDTQGASGELQRCAAMAADLMISPLKPDLINYLEFLSGTLKLIEQLNAMSDLSTELRSGTLCLLLNAMDRTKNARVISNSVREQFRSHPGVQLLDQLVPASTIYPSSRSNMEPVFATDPPGREWLGRSGYEVMHHLLHEVLPHLKGVWLDATPPDVTTDSEAGARA